MVHIAKDIYFDNDGGMNYILCRQVITQPGANVKPENIGQVRYDTLGYYPTFHLLAAGAAKVLEMEVLTDAGWVDMLEAAEAFREAVKALPVFGEGEGHA
jgi:hypothetical protein